MFFGFQTPTSEFAQALVDFHHYVFFFLVVVTIFVVWMIKLSLLFVMREKNLLYKDTEHPSDFYIENNNKWFSHKGELYYLINSFSSNLWSALTFDLKTFLSFFFIFYAVYVPVIFLFFSRFFFLVNSFYTTILVSIINENMLYAYLRSGFPRNLSLDLTKNNNIFAKNIWVFQSSFWQKLYITDVNSFGDQWVNFSTYLNNRTTSFFSSLKNMLPVAIKTNQTNIISLIPAVVITNIRSGFSSIRLSHWTWSGKDKNVFLLFTGDGDSYGYPSNEFHAFDENSQMPQALKFLSFYNKDLWSHSFLFFQNVRHRLVLEWVWTFIPTLILLILVIPSLYLLYSYDRPYVTAPYLTFKAIGHQWYWSYEYWDYTHANGGCITFDSYMLHEDDLELGQLRLLEVDRRVVLPAGVCIRLLTTSTDVLHSWAVPAFGVKIDSIPGRLNQFWLVLNKPGVFYGQCSELCGVNHGFMPIAVEVVFLDQYLDFIGLNCDWFN